MIAMPEFEWQFTLVLLTNGVMIGLMYALIALGFVLIYKATDAINFAQGEFVMFAGFIAAAAALGRAVVLGCGGDLDRRHGRARFRPRTGRAAAAARPAGHRGRHGDDRARGGVARRRDAGCSAPARSAIVMPVGDEPLFLGPVMLPPVQLVGAGVSIVFLAGFTWFFLKSRTGVAMRAVADNQQVAMAMGINVRRYFALAWAMAGVVSALGGVVWGAMLGVDNQLAAGRAEGVPGGDPGRARFDRRRGGRRADRRRRREPRGRLSRSVCRRRHQGFRAVRADDPGADDPARGMFGRRADRARLRREPRRRGGEQALMFYREAGVFKTSYAADMALFPLPQTRWAVAAIAVLFIVIAPLAFGPYYLSILNLVLVAVVGALGLNILVGYTGLISIGHGAFMSVGAYTAANLICGSTRRSGSRSRPAG